MKNISLKINDEIVNVESGSTVATAVFVGKSRTFRRSVSGESRTPLCGMGTCFECRVSIDGDQNRRSCQVLAEDGMQIITDE